MFPEAIGRLSHLSSQQPSEAAWEAGEVAFHGSGWILTADISEEGESRVSRAGGCLPSFSHSCLSIMQIRDAGPRGQFVSDPRQFSCLLNSGERGFSRKGAMLCSSS